MQTGDRTPKRPSLARHLSLLSHIRDSDSLSEHSSGDSMDVMIGMTEERMDERKATAAMAMASSGATQQCLLFPTYATQQTGADGSAYWDVNVRGWAFIKNRGTLQGKLVKSISRSVAGVNKKVDGDKVKILDERVSFFVTKSVANRKFIVEPVTVASHHHMHIEGGDGEMHQPRSPTAFDGPFNVPGKTFTDGEWTVTSVRTLEDEGYYSKSENTTLSSDNASDAEHTLFSEIFSDNTIVYRNGLYCIDDSSPDEPSSGFDLSSPLSDEPDELPSPVSPSLSDRLTPALSPRPRNPIGNNFDRRMSIRSNMTSPRPMTPEDWLSSPLSPMSPLPSGITTPNGTSISTMQSGHFAGHLKVTNDEVDDWAQQQGQARPRLLKIRTQYSIHRKATSPLLHQTLPATSWGYVNLIPPRGISVISDIDDTIKETGILEGAKAVLAKTFLELPKEVAGMAELYMQWYNMGAEYHYVSNSPIQLFPMLSSFFDTYNYPPGSSHLRLYSSLFSKLRETPGQAKRDTILKIMNDFPERQFVLIGDSGEIDLEVYCDVVRQVGFHRVVAIFIRDVGCPGKHKTPKSPRQSSLPKSKDDTSIPARLRKPSRSSSEPSISLDTSTATLSIDDSLMQSDPQSPNINLIAPSPTTPTTPTSTLSRIKAASLASLIRPTPQQAPVTSSLSPSPLQTRIEKALGDLPRSLVYTFQDGKDLEASSECVKQALLQYLNACVSDTFAAGMSLHRRKRTKISPKEPVELLCFGYEAKVFGHEKSASTLTLLHGNSEDPIWVDRFDVRHLFDTRQDMERALQEDGIRQDSVRFDKERYRDLPKDEALLYTMDEQEREEYLDQQKEEEKRQEHSSRYVGYNYDTNGSADHTYKNADTDHTVTLPYVLKTKPPKGILPPPTEQQALIIHKTAKFVQASSNPTQSEILVHAKQSKSPLFTFLSKTNALYPYYRWYSDFVKLGVDGYGSSEEESETSKVPTSAQVDNEILRKIAQTVAKSVNGPLLEDKLRRLHGKDPKFAFLNRGSPGNKEYERLRDQLRNDVNSES